eukprot:scaffold20385_cov121-Isochrysis_galbana.AAC.4
MMQTIATAEASSSVVYSTSGHMYIASPDGESSTSARPTHRGRQRPFKPRASRSSIDVARVSAQSRLRPPAGASVGTPPSMLAGAGSSVTDRVQPRSNGSAGGFCSSCSRRQRCMYSVLGGSISGIAIAASRKSVRGEGTGVTARAGASSTALRCPLWGSVTDRFLLRDEPTLPPACAARLTACCAGESSPSLRSSWWGCSTDA